MSSGFPWSSRVTLCSSCCKILYPQSTTQNEPPRKNQSQSLSPGLGRFVRPPIDSHEFHQEHVVKTATRPQTLNPKPSPQKSEGSRVVHDFLDQQYHPKLPCTLASITSLLYKLPIPPRWHKPKTSNPGSSTLDTSKPQ